MKYFKKGFGLLCVELVIFLTIDAMLTFGLKVNQCKTIAYTLCVNGMVVLSILGLGVAIFVLAQLISLRYNNGSDGHWRGWRRDDPSPIRPIPPGPPSCMKDYFDEKIRHEDLDLAGKR